MCIYIYIHTIEVRDDAAPRAGADLRGLFSGGTPGILSVRGCCLDIPRFEEALNN